MWPPSVKASGLQPLDLAQQREREREREEGGKGIYTSPTAIIQLILYGIWHCLLPKCLLSEGPLPFSKLKIAWLHKDREKNITLQYFTTNNIRVPQYGYLGLKLVHAYTEKRKKMGCQIYYTSIHLDYIVLFPFKTWYYFCWTNQFGHSGHLIQCKDVR